MNFTRRALEGMKKSPFIVLICLLSIWSLTISHKITLEDYRTSYSAYADFPTIKIDPDVVKQIAWLPQILPILFGVYWMRDTRNKWALYASLTIMAIDILTDTWFKTDHFSMGWWIIMDWPPRLGPAWNIGGILETFFAYTVGSEVLVTVASSILFYSLRPAVIMVFVILAAVITAIREIKVEVRTVLNKKTPVKDGNQRESWLDEEEDEPGYRPSFPTSGYRRGGVATKPRRGENFQATHGFFDTD